MRYMLLCYDDEKAWQRKGQAALQAAMDEAAGLCREIDAKGQYLLASPLHPSAEATSVKVRDEKPVVTDGPFVETHEQLGGFYLIDVDTVEEAIAIAKRHPGAPLGTVVVRRVFDLAGLPENRV
jgi:hypothetical protein